MQLKRYGSVQIQDSALSCTTGIAFSYATLFLRNHLQCIETSPLGYRMAKWAFCSLAGSLSSHGLGSLRIPVKLRGECRRQLWPLCT
jgi:hypothetical protein